LKLQFDSALEKKVKSLLGKMSRAEKVSLLSGFNFWKTVPIPRLGIPSITVTDGPHGVRTCEPQMGRKTGPVTWFPSGISMGSSWDPELAGKMAGAIAEETRFYDCDVLLGPCINIMRAPLNGRHFETFSEDPYLSGRVAVGYVKGLQEKGVGCSVKHFACNNQETERFRASSEVDERTLREIYLPAFEAVVKEAQPATVMCSYNRVNGVYASQNEFLLTQVLRKEWGFKGLVVSDWSAVHDTLAPVPSGLDLEMPGPARYFGRLLEDAVQNWQIDIKHIDRAAANVLRVVLALAQARQGKGAANTRAHQTLSRKSAEQSVVLLKNDQSALPLEKGKLKTLAVLGPNADKCPIGGGSSIVQSPYRVSPLAALKRRLEGVNILHERGCENFDIPPLVPSMQLKPAKGKGQGLLAQFYNNASFRGKPVLERVDPIVNMWSWASLPDKCLTDPYSLKYSGWFQVPEDGKFKLAVLGLGAIKVFVDGRRVASMESPGPQAHHEDLMCRTEADLELKKNRWYPIKIEYRHSPDLNFSHVRFCLGRTSATGFKEEIARAAELARRSDAAVVVAGYPDEYEGEGFDRKHMKLSGEQDRLIEAVAAANPRTVVVLNAGSPVEMPWAGKVKAILLAGYAGQETGEAVASILLGEVNPSGKLPCTFPKRLVDNPTHGTFPGGQKVLYKEGVFVGYRWYDRKNIKPLFCFGHGLSYTQFKYGDLVMPSSARRGRPVPLSMTVTNTGKRPGAEVVQVYVGDAKASVPRPKRELKAFAKVFLKPGESRRLSFKLDQRALSFFDPKKKKWIAEPGKFKVEIGSSSRDIRLKGSFLLA
jgi:beta-glucosidase